MRCTDDGVLPEYTAEKLWEATQNEFLGLNGRPQYTLDAWRACGNYRVDHPMFLRLFDALTIADFKPDQNRTVKQRLIEAELFWLAAMVCKPVDNVLLLKRKRLGIDMWSMCALRMNVVKDIRLLIAQRLWKGFWVHF